MAIKIKMVLLMLICCVLAFSACDKKENDNNTLIVLLFGTILNNAVTAGAQSTYAADGLAFNMVFVPGGLSFRTGTGDLGTAAVDRPFWIGETEVTYELWYAVHHWAVTDTGGGTREDGGPLYTFANPGREGSGGADGAEPATTQNEPVAMINWRDSLVWCNALTEWYNCKKSTTYSCAYYTDPACTIPLRVVDDSVELGLNPGEQDNPCVRDDATGFRMPASMEWECAARYAGDESDYGMYEYPAGSGDWWTPGNYASGALAPYTDWPATDAVAWFGNSLVAGTGNATSAQPVMGRLPNALGLYDVSGNVWEWCFDWHPDFIDDARMRRGGSWYAPTERLQTGYGLEAGPDDEYGVFGLRIVMSAL